MLFIQILRNLDELFYEVMSWLLFYPLTLWRTVRHPWREMAYAELGEATGARYADRVSPPTFLMLTLLLTHLLEIATVGTNPLIADRHGLAALIDSDTNLLLFPLVRRRGCCAGSVGGSTARRCGRPFTRNAMSPRPWRSRSAWQRC